MRYFSELASVKIFNAVSVAKSESVLSDEISASNVSGYFSLQWEISGDGTVKFEVLPSNNGTDFLDVVEDIAVSQTKSTGPDSNGKNFASFYVPACLSFKVKVTETGGSNGVTVSAWLKGQ